MSRDIKYLIVFMMAHLFIQESYAMLNDFGVTVPKEENDKVDTLRYSFQKLMAMSVSTN